MTRYSGTYSSGNIVYGGANNTVIDFLDALATILDNVGWTVTQTAASPRAYLFESSGENNAIITITATMSGVNTFNIVAKQNGVSGTAAACSLNSTHDVGYALRLNEYEVSFVTVCNSLYRLTSFGSPLRGHISNAASGVCFSTDAVSAGSGVVIPVDRDLTETLQVGQSVWIFKDGTDDLEVVTVTAVDEDSVTATIANDHVSGSIIGLDPCPVYAESAGAGSAPQCQFPNELDGTDGPITGSSTPLRTNITEAANDPAPTGLYIGLRSMLATPLGFRGIQQHIAYWTQGAQADSDLMRDNYDDSARYKVFPSINISSGFCVSIGPGA